VPRQSRGQLLLTVENTGTQRWPCTSVAPTARVSLWGYLGESSESRPLEWEMIIPHDLDPGELIQIPLGLVQPSRPGTYEIAIVTAIGGRPAQKADPHLSWSARYDVVVPK